MSKDTFFFSPGTTLCLLSNSKTKRLLEKGKSDAIPVFATWAAFSKAKHKRVFTKTILHRLNGYRNSVTRENYLK